MESRCAARGDLGRAAVLFAVSELFGSVLALSVGLAPASSPKGGATGVSVRLPLDEQSTMSRKR